MEDKKNDYTLKEEQIARFAKALGHPARVAILLFHAIRKEIREQLPGDLPVYPVDTILHLGSLYLSLYQAGIFQLLQMLGNGSLRYRQFLMYRPKITGLPLCQKMQDSDPSRMS